QSYRRALPTRRSSDLPQGGPGPGEVHREGVGVEAAVRWHHRRPDAPSRRRGGLEPGPVHHGRGPVPRGPHHLQTALRRRPDLPGRTAGQLVAGAPDRGLRPRGQTRGRRGWEGRRQSGGTIGAQMRRLGDGVDWSRDRFTMDEGLSRAVRTIFKQLYDAGLIYQAERLVNWSPVLQTAISDLEVKYEDVEGE